MEALARIDGNGPACGGDLKVADRFHRSQFAKTALLAIRIVSEPVQKAAQCAALFQIPDLSFECAGIGLVEERFILHRARPGDCRRSDLRQLPRITSSMRLTLSGSASGVMPWPRLKIWGPCENARTMRRVSLTSRAPPVTISDGSRLP